MAVGNFFFAVVDINRSAVEPIRIDLNAECE